MEHHLVDEAAVRLAPNNQRETTSSDSQLQQELAEPALLAAIPPADVLGSTKPIARKANWTQFHRSNRSGRNTMTHVF